MVQDVVSIRDAVPGDAGAIAEIYNYYVTSTTVTFDTEPKTPEDRAGWLFARGPEHPVLVAQIAERVVGWASISPYSPRPAWSQTVELGLYLASDERGKGIGQALISAALDRATSLGHHAVIGQIVADNKPSLRLGERNGFVEVGRLREVGRKFDRLLDVVIQEKIL